MTVESPPLASAAGCRLGPGDPSLNVASAVDPEHRSEKGLAERLQRGTRIHANHLRGLARSCSPTSRIALLTAGKRVVDVVAQRPLVLIAKRPREWMQYEAPGQEVNVIAAEDAVFTDHLIW